MVKPLIEISILAPARGATRSEIGLFLRLIFQFSPLREGRHYSPSTVHCQNTISILAPARGATWNSNDRLCTKQFQFSPLREGRPLDFEIPAGEKGISILAPARGATRPALHVRLYPPISILAPARGATCRVGNGSDLRLFQFSPLREGRRGCTGGCTVRRPDFNSRPCERGDATFYADLAAIQISILAPARGATASRRRAKRPCRFQFSPLREGRLCATMAGKSNFPFQFSPLREGRHTGCWCAAMCLEFQFSPLREGRLGRMPGRPIRCDFNSRPCERGDKLANSWFVPRDLFQFSPLREGRQVGQGCWYSCHQISILAPARGATERNTIRFPCRRYFNSRPCERGDLSGDLPDGLLKHFNSRLCERGDSLVFVKRSVRR